jgi:hypothetical protein
LKKKRTIDVLNGIIVLTWQPIILVIFISR